MLFYFAHRDRGLWSTDTPKPPIWCTILGHLMVLLCIIYRIHLSNSSFVIITEWLEHCLTMYKVEGSNPTWFHNFFYFTLTFFIVILSACEHNPRPPCAHDPMKHTVRLCHLGISVCVSPLVAHLLSLGKLWACIIYPVRWYFVLLV